MRVGKPFASTVPSTSAGNVTTLGNTDSSGVDFITASDGTQYSIDAEGVVYVLTDQGWTADDGTTATIQQAFNVAPQAVAQAYAGASTWDKFLDTLKSTIPVLLQSKAQSDLLNVNLDRAKRGLPPLTAQNYMPGVNVGLDAGTKQMLTYGAVGLLGVMIFQTVMKHR